MCIHACISMYIYVYAYVAVYIYCMYRYMYIYYVCICMCICIFVYLYMYMYMYMNMYMYVYMYILIKEPGHINLTNNFADHFTTYFSSTLPDLFSCYSSLFVTFKTSFKPFLHFDQLAKDHEYVL